MTDTPDSPERIWVDDERPIGGSCHVYTAKAPGVEMNQRLERHAEKTP